MRRIQQDETLHGTRDGQVAVDRELVRAYALTEREALCSSLLREGASVPDVARRLEISTSTAEKHLGSLRRKLGVTTTREAAVLLVRLMHAETPEITNGFGSIPIVEAGFEDALTVERAEAFREAGHLRDVLSLSLDALRTDGAGAIFYYFLPLSAASFRKTDVIHARVAPPALMADYQDPTGWFATRVAPLLFAETDRIVAFDLEHKADCDGGVEMPPELASEHRHENFRYGITLGAPYGAGYFVFCALYHPVDENEFDRDLGRTVQGLRREMRIAQNAAYSFGALARSVGLTLRERDALALIAEGFSAGKAAERMKTSDRAFAALIKAAKTKLGTKTSAAAVAKAMALNALVFF